MLRGSLVSRRREAICEMVTTSALGKPEFLKSAQATFWQTQRGQKKTKPPDYTDQATVPRVLGPAAPGR